MQFVCPRCSEEPQHAWTLGHIKAETPTVCYGKWTTETGPNKPTPFIWKKIIFWLKGAFLRPEVSTIQTARIKTLQSMSPWQLGGVPKTHKLYKTLSELHGFSSSLVFQLPLAIHSFILARYFCALHMQPLADCCIHVLYFGGRVKERKFLCSPGHNPCFYEIWTLWPAQQRLQVGRQIWTELCRGPYLIYFCPKGRVEFEMGPDAFSQGHL